MKKINSFGAFLNENLSPTYDAKALMTLMQPVLNQVKAATFTKEAQEAGDISDEQVLGIIISKLFSWDYEKISAVAAYAYEDSNYRDEAANMFREAGISEGLTESNRGNHMYELIFSDGVSGMLKGNDPKKLIAKILEKPNVREWALFSNKDGFHSTTQEEYLINWWGDGSYWDNMSKKDKSLVTKKYMTK